MLKVKLYFFPFCLTLLIHFPFQGPAGENPGSRTTSEKILQPVTSAPTGSSVTEPSSRLPMSSQVAGSSGAPQIKRSRLSAPAPSSTITATTSSPIVVQTSSMPSVSMPSSKPLVPVVDEKNSIHQMSHHYDPLDMEEEQDEEEVMISMDDVKPEPIAVYSLNDENDDDSLGHPGGDSLNESSG